MSSTEKALDELWEIANRHCAKVYDEYLIDGKQGADIPRRPADEVEAVKAVTAHLKKFV